MQQSEHDDVTLIACGSILAEALQAAEALRADGCTARVLSMPTIKPLDRAAVLRCAAETPLLVTVEEHSIVGGLGSAIAEVLAELPGPRARLVRHGSPDHIRHVVGSQQSLRGDAATLRALVLRSLQEDPS